jgi:S-adenosylmethionine:tRNA ribosyltransferase-isomerase
MLAMTVAGRTRIITAMRTADFDFDLPPELIAQEPAAKRDHSRLLVLHREGGRVEHRQFGCLPEYLREGDVLVLNNSRVIPARLRAFNPQTGGRLELLLLEENGTNDWWVMLRPGRRARVGTRMALCDARGEPRGASASVVEMNAEGHRRLLFSDVSDIARELEAWGEVPLPPYLRRPEPGPSTEDRRRYQTVFACAPGSVAAPTAGLHFTEALLDALRLRGVVVCFVTLHVGLGTFAPVKAETPAGHRMHEERYELSVETARLVMEAKRAGHRVVAVGTTTVRVLESVAALNQGRLEPGPGRTRIFIYPPWQFRIVDALLTNFHLPRSTLLMLASAFLAPMRTCGRPALLSAYAAAVRERYRFFSYGDAMLIL